MGNSRQGRIPSELGWLVDELDDVQRRLSTLEQPSGEALSSTVAKLQGLVENIQEQIDAWAATRWTNAQITDQINAAVAAYVGSVLAGNVAIGGELRVEGTVTMPGARATFVGGATPDRVAAWLAGDGRLGYT